MEARRKLLNDVATAYCEKTPAAHRSRSNFHRNALVALHKDSPLLYNLLTGGCCLSDSYILYLMGVIPFKGVCTVYFRECDRGWVYDELRSSGYSINKPCTVLRVPFSENTVASYSSTADSVIISLSCYRLDTYFSLPEIMSNFGVRYLVLSNIRFTKHVLEIDYPEEVANERLLTQYGNDVKVSIAKEDIIRIKGYASTLPLSSSLDDLVDREDRSTYLVTVSSLFAACGWYVAHGVTHNDLKTLRNVREETKSTPPRG